jgi:hypothetical protein
MGAFIQDANVLAPYAGISFLYLIFAIAAFSLAVCIGT